MTDVQSRVEALVDQYYWDGTSGHNCAATVTLVMRDYYGLENEYIPRMANAFGGGVSNTHRGLCGGLTGALIMIGVLYDGRAAELGERLLDHFSSGYGSHICCDVVGIDFDDEEQVARDKDRTSEEICRPMLKDVCYWMVQQLDRPPCKEYIALVDDAVCDT